jgi:hypothetical protein
MKKELHEMTEKEIEDELDIINACLGAKSKFLKVIVSKIVINENEKFRHVELVFTLILDRKGDPFLSKKYDSGEAYIYPSNLFYKEVDELFRFHFNKTPEWNNIATTGWIIGWYRKIEEGKMDILCLFEWQCRSCRSLFYTLRKKTKIKLACPFCYIYGAELLGKMRVEERFGIENIEEEEVPSHAKRVICNQAKKCISRHCHHIKIHIKQKTCIESQCLIEKQLLFAKCYPVTKGIK